MGEYDWELATDSLGNWLQTVGRNEASSVNQTWGNETSIIEGLRYVNRGVA